MKYTVMLLCALLSVAVQANVIHADYAVDEDSCRGASLVAKAASIYRDHGVPIGDVIHRLRTSAQSSDPMYQARLPSVLRTVRQVYAETQTPEETEAAVLSDCRKTIGQNLKF